LVGASIHPLHWRAHSSRYRSTTQPPPSASLLTLGPGRPTDRIIFQSTRVREHRLFRGKLGWLSLGFRGAGAHGRPGAPEGDFRDYEEIDRWAEQIAASLRAACGLPEAEWSVRAPRAAVDSSATRCPCPYARAPRLSRPHLATALLLAITASRVSLRHGGACMPPAQHTASAGP
jgi:hypothetical protein